MGSSYTNIILSGPEAHDILQELGNQGRSAFVSPTEDGLTAVYEMDSDAGETAALITLAGELSEYFGCPALAVLVRGDDLFRYWLYADGELLDSYESSGATARKRARQPELLSQFFNPDVTREELADILYSLDPDDMSLAVDRHLSLSELLGLPLCAVGFGFGDLDSGEYPEDLDEENLLRSGEN